jgi:hypothetical protein
MHEHARRRSGKTNLGEHVGGEALAAKDDEVADRAREKRNQCSDYERVLHEMELQQQLEVG